jgi:hypothetical protein
MKTIKLLSFLFIILLFNSCNKTNNTNKVNDKTTEDTREYYQLKVYTFDSASQVATTDKYLKDAYLPGLKKIGITNIGVFKPIPNETDSIQKTYVLIPFTSMEQFVTHEHKLNNDENYLLAGNTYINAPYNEPPYQRVESTLMKAFEDMPIMQPSKLESPRADRIYELRSYESATEQYHKNKVDMFNAGGEVKLFEHLNFNAVFYAEVISGSKMPNLMYMTTFDNQESRDEHWKAFGSAPEWNELKVMKKYQNNVSHIDITFLYPTDYSDY